MGSNAQGKGQQGTEADRAPRTKGKSLTTTTTARPKMFTDGM